MLQLGAVLLDKGWRPQHQNMNSRVETPLPLQVMIVRFIKDMIRITNTPRPTPLGH